MTDPSILITPKEKAPVIPISAARRIGGRAWRKANGLETIADKVNEYLARRFLRPGAMFPMPEDLAPGWRSRP